MPFEFPDPNIKSQVVHPITGEIWHFVDGAWEVEDSDTPTVELPSPKEVISRLPVVINRFEEQHHKDEHHAEAFAVKSIEEEVDQNEEQLQAVSTTLLNLVNKVETLEDLDIQDALSALAKASQDIIELKSKVSSLELTSFLILE